MNSIFLIGYYGYGNFGDEVLLKTFINKLKGNGKWKRIHVLSTKYHSHDKITYIPRFSFFHIFRAVRQSDIVLFGGGGIFQDTTSSKSLYYYIFLILLAKLTGKKVLVAFQGIGPLKRRINHYIFRYVIDHFLDYVSLRDVESLQLLKNTVKVRRPLQYFDDPSLSFFRDSVDLTTMNNLENVLGLNVRQTGNEEINADHFAAIINRIVEKYNVSLKFFILQEEHELDLVTKINSMLTVKATVCQLTIDNFTEVFKCNYLLAMRLHLLILAFSANIRFLGITYDPKVSNFLDGVDTGKVSLDLDTLETKLEQLLSGNVKKRNDEIFEGKINSVEAGFKALFDLINDGGSPGNGTV
ncbi:MAG TPA: hypothetical protein DF296_14630 [Candidatus Margulisbacteria bacterium]|nr:MAG: hypothetical protein A2X43_03370 [Candidatus Margulisbacteria bacterium GWD2_39_127]OGI02003.1 MAG: hypothetical protein A2X42_08980 [Candidatus Margulisbacteria bacterium GWF2_38_17]OGI11398.1 MAG: hypothetical protein A2X41_12115 [Candidatus Margulisbacteria bacterium GWE2_39_32]HAR62462.1 hypothetical protein [Candidatus Margulisiibacteriota bacterium]HCT86424.1 hypothetical protein [Candidatus Margulisiibacteriota bacterium]